MRTLDEFATRHLAPLGITLIQAEADAVGYTELEAYRTPRALEALRRLHARANLVAVPVAAYAPVLPPTAPTTIADGGDGEHVLVRHDDCEVAVAHGDLVGHLHHAGLAAKRETHRSLIVDTPATAALLASLARHDTAHPTAAAVLDWWLQRAEHPGSGACYVATRAATERWVTGGTTHDEREPLTWQRWLRLPAGSPTQVAEAIVLAAAEGPTLTGLLECHGGDSASWTRLMRFGLSRRKTESRRDAALGLTSRNQAAEHYTSLRLSDPLVAQAALREGHLTHAVITSTDRREVQLQAPAGPCRLRVGAQTQAWLGTIEQAGGPLGIRSGVVTHVGVTNTGDLVITLTDAIVLAQASTGSTVTLRPREVDPFQQARLRSQYVHRLRDQRNWVTRNAPPPVARRQVPLDVVVAAATDQT